MSWDEPEVFLYFRRNFTEVFTSRKMIFGTNLVVGYHFCLMGDQVGLADHYRSLPGQRPGPSQSWGD